MLKKAFERTSELSDLTNAPDLKGLHTRGAVSRDLSSFGSLAGEQTCGAGSFDEQFAFDSSPAKSNVLKTSEDSPARDVLPQEQDGQEDSGVPNQDDVFAFEHEADHTSGIRWTCSDGGKDERDTQVPSGQGSHASAYAFKATSSAPDLLISQTLNNSLRISHQHLSVQNLSECNSYGSQVPRTSLPLAIQRSGHDSPFDHKQGGGSPSEGFQPPHEVIAASFKGQIGSFVGSALNHNTTVGSRHRSVADRIRHTVFEQQG